MPYEYEDEAEIYRVEQMSIRLAHAIGWGFIIGCLAGAAIILLAAYL